MCQTSLTTIIDEVSAAVCCLVHVLSTCPDFYTGLTENLLQTEPADFDEVIEKLFGEVSALEDFPKITDPQLEECAIQLWNWAVTKNVGTSISKNHKAKVRHVACSLLYCCEPDNPTEGVLRKQILMAGKTGRTWLDCKNPQMADNVLRLAVKSLETLYSKLTSRGDGAADITSSKGDVEKDLLRILSCQAESALSQGNNNDAVACIQRCKEMLLRLPKDVKITLSNIVISHLPYILLLEVWVMLTVNIFFSMQTAYLSLMCYNFGIDTYEVRKFEDSVFWLRDQLVFECLNRVCQHFESSPDLGTALVLHVELLLQRGKELLGKQKIEDIITGHYTGKQLSPQALTRLHVMLWDQASKHFEARNYTEALQWYNYSLSFFKRGQMEPNSAKLQRNRASCFLQLKQLEKAKEAIKEAERCDPDNIFTQFSIYKIAVLENNVGKAAEALNVMGHLSKSPVASGNKLLVSGNAASNLLSLAAQIALENGQQETAVKALESLCEHSKDEAQVLTALRCLVRLVLSTTEESRDEMSKCVHSLIKLSLPSGVSEVEAHVLEEVWGYYEEALSIIAAAPDDFPEIETLWLLTEAWNTGILLYSLAQYPESEKWCGLAMRFVRYLGSLQESYEIQMSSLYSEILDKLDKAKKNHIMEE
ncbi:Testis-expressed protein 11 [Collichthys lucidus]|uniref:Protein ZIP4 homolog n=1 Tax=Collichthys lucidus TaxID=240159 RepID=A0A4U5UCW5_COLLU|nr:Testis-expressed protein 11 [Collichthys lucidus]